MDKMLSYAKLQKKQKKQKLDYWTENLKIMNPIFFFLSNGSQYVFLSVYSQTMK